MKTKLMSLLLLCAGIISFVTSCSEDSKMEEPKAIFTIDVTGDLVFEATKGTKELTYTTNQKMITFSDVPEWCHVSVEEKGIVISVDANTEGTERSATIVIIAGELKTPLKIIQKAEFVDPDAKVFTRDSVYFAYTGTVEGEEELVKVLIDETISSASIPPIKRNIFSVKYAQGGKELLFSANSNNGVMDECYATVTLSNGKEYKIKLFLDFKKRAYGDVIEVGGNKGIVYKVNADGSGYAISIKEWRSGEKYKFKNTDGTVAIYGGDYPKWISHGYISDEIGSRYFKTTEDNGTANMDLWRAYHNELKANPPAEWSVGHASFWPSMHDLIAFRWCEELNTTGNPDWFLPSVEELKTFSNIYRDNDEEFNKLLVENGGVAIGNSEYWSSTEVLTGKNPQTGKEQSQNAKYVNLSEGVSKDDYKNKPTGHAVRAIVKFGK